MPMAEGKRGRRTPEGRSASTKVTQGVANGNNVLHVNLDVRSGVPRATVLNPRQQQQPQVLQPNCKTSVNGSIPNCKTSLNGSIPNCKTSVNGSIPVFIPVQKPHPQNNNINSNKNIFNKSSFVGNNYHRPTINTQTSSTGSTYQRETLDDPPKYDDIFSTHAYHLRTEHQTQQQQHKNYEKRPLKSYFLRHFPKVRTFNKHTGNRSFNQSAHFGSSGVGSESGKDSYYTQIFIPPPNTVNQFGGVSQHSPSTVEIGEATSQVPPVNSQFCPQEAGQSPDRKYTITLKPGSYRINVQWRSKTQPFRLTLTPSRRGRGEGEAPPPPEEQPLYYGSCEAHEQFVNQDVNTSLPRRLVHRLLFRHHSSPPLECSYPPEEEELSQEAPTDMTSHLPECQVNHQPQCQQPQPQQVAPHVQLQQQVAQQQHQLLQQHVGLNPAAGGDRKGQKRCWEGGPRHRQRKSRYRLAERKKNEGNELYKAKDYREALKLYTQAIDLCPDCAAYYSNRSACYMMLGKYHDALNDAREAVRLDTTFVKGYLRVAKCNIALGDANAALSVLRQAGELEPTNRSVRDEMNNAQALLRCIDEVHKAIEKTDYRTAIFHLDRALDQAVGCKSLKITKAEYLVFLQRFADAQEMVNEILQFDSANADAIYVRGMCLYYQDNPESAFNHFQHVLRLAPDHQKARDIYKKAKSLKQKKEEGNESFKRGSFQEAYNLYTDALAIDPLNKNTNAKLYFNRATVGSKLNKLEEAIEDCTAAINLDEGYVKAYLRRAKCYQTLEKHEEAVRDYEKVTRLDRNQEHKRLLHEAKIQLKRSKRKDYYKILGVSKTASEDEIKKSYRKMALVHHPDRHANASEKDKREHEIKFKEIGEAYSVLTDSKKRAMYDRGQDINDPDGGFGHEADIDPNQIFQAFFGNHGGHGFGAHASFQQGGFPGGGFSGGSFPGGFHFQFG